MADSDADTEAVEKLIADSNDLFRSVGLEVKGSNISRCLPHPDVTCYGVSVDIGGMVWWPMTNIVMVKIPSLHFGQKQIRRLKAGTEIFDGSFQDLIKFVLDKLTSRQVYSEFRAIVDSYGKLNVDIKQTVMETTEWAGVLTKETR